MKALFLVFHGFDEHNGISKKIRYQVQALKNIGVDTVLCYSELDSQGNSIRYVDDQVLDHFGAGILSKINKRFSYGRLFNFIKNNGIDLVYVRHNFNSNPFLINMFKKLRRIGVKIVLEIPTYPYDGEFINCSRAERLSLRMDQFFRAQMAGYINKIITFTDATTIFGQETINISNGIDFESIRLKDNKSNYPDELNLISVSEVHVWHGLDRVIHGLADYYAAFGETAGMPVAKFHLVGRGFGKEFEDLRALVARQGLADKVIFYGNKWGEELDEIFNRCDFGIASLGRHRSGITKIKTLKNREYAARGVPFIYSEIDDDFENMPYVLKAAPDDTPIDIVSIINFYAALQQTPQEIRSSIEHTLSWNQQMRKVIESI